jgi:acetyl-CoA carboxylase biotin carboxylase subunit
MFKKVLIANRGEIAVRAIRACRELGVRTVAVYSDADRNALHVRMADEAVHLGPAPSRESYLVIEKVLDAAKRTGAEAIHPGYGFLSENAGFAQACLDAGIVFIGPPPSAMKMLGSKTSARQAMEKAGVPFVPGSTHGLTLPEAQETAAKIGYPVMLKAAAGGGGKGMRLVHSAAELPSAYDSASSEALRSFSNGEVYIEKYIERPRHVEIQIIADSHGNVVHLGERECSMQRRHQKVIEESPSPVLDADLRARMGATAVRVAQAAGYVNAGTVEFLLDAQRNFYFLEVNTRLQVEHPVTEMVTGLDLVHLQLHIAAGGKLPFSQVDVQLRGHALECRIYAEDPDNSFFPSPGLIQRLCEPGGAGVRVDSGVFEGWRVPLDYDPMLAKLIVHAATREQAIERMLRALDEYFVGGIKTNLGMFQRILQDANFRAGNVDTGYLDRMLVEVKKEKTPASAHELHLAAIAAVMFTRAGNSKAISVTAVSTDTKNKTTESVNWKQSARREALRS